MRRFTPSWGAGKPDPEPGVDVELSATSLPGPCATVESLVGLNNIVSAEQTDVWEAHIQKMMYLTARKFGFQTFNRGGPASKPDDQVEWVPASAFLAADHLCHLLITDGLPREVGIAGDNEGLERALGQAVWRLHQLIFEAYGAWAALVRVKEFPDASVTAAWSDPLGSAQSTNAALLDLCLYFGLWTEAANLKHTPELMWFLFWCMRHSTNFLQLEQHRCPSPWDLEPAARSDLKLLRDLRIRVRNEYKGLIMEHGRAFEQCPGNEDPSDRTPLLDFDDFVSGNGTSVKSDNKYLPLIKKLNTARSTATGVFDLELKVLVEMVGLRDGGGFTQRIVQPIFACLAYEVGHKGDTGKEIALRIGYDDVNESFASASNIKEIMATILHPSGTADGRATADPRNAFHRLWTLGGDAPWKEDRASKHYAGNEAITADPTKPTVLGEPQRKGWLRKTYQERRTWFALFRAFFRVLAFHILLFHACLALALSDLFDGRWWVPVSTVTIMCWCSEGGAEYNTEWVFAVTHAFLEAVYGYAGSFLEAPVRRPPAGSKNKSLHVYQRGVMATLCCCIPYFAKAQRDATAFEKETQRLDEGKRNQREWTVRNLNTTPSLINRIFLTLVWTAVCAALVAIFVGQFVASQSPDIFFSRKHLRDWWGWVAVIYMAVVIVHWGPLTWRDGYIQGAHSVKSGVSSTWTWIIRACDGFNSCFARGLQGEAFLFVNPKVGITQTLLNTGFWLLVFVMKLPFDYFLLIKPLARPIRALLTVGWLSVDKGTFKNSSIPYPDGDWILVGAIAFPAFIMVMVDTGVFYQLAVFVFGCFNGMFHLQLGQVTNWNDVIREFDSGVSNLYRKILSADAQEKLAREQVTKNYFDRTVLGTANARAVKINDKDSMKVSDLKSRPLGPWMAFSFLWDKVVTHMRENDIISDTEHVNLQFKKVPLLSKYGIRPIIFPCCFYAGKVQSVMDAGLAPNAARTSVLKEMHCLLLVLLRELRFLPEGTTKMMSEAVLLPTTESQYHLEVREKLVGALKEFVEELRVLGELKLDETGKRSKCKKRLAAFFASLGNHLEIELTIYAKSSSMGLQAAVNVVKSAVNAFNEKHGVEGAKAAYTKVPADVDEMLETLYKNADAGATTGFSEAYDIKVLLQVFHDAMSLTETEAQPRSEEACRAIRFFMSSLFNPHLATPRPVELMRSLTTLVPHYEEDVLYPLDNAEIERQTHLKAKAGETTNLCDPMAGYEITTAEYMRITNAEDWENFVERMVKKFGVKLDQAKQLTERDWQAGGIFGEPKANAHGDASGSAQVQDKQHLDLVRVGSARMDLMMWASKRGQLLSRTVHGMMLYERALHDLIELEHPGQDMDDPAVQRLLESKFRHIVSSQVYGKMKGSDKAKEKWLAYSVDKLMEQFPSFRVAYIDGVTGIAPGAMATQYSVLLRHNPTRGANGQGAVEELYRVKLPQQGVTKKGVVLGEGKPENQNHAAVFCFGECVQTIDMNQDGNLAEAYKMRNLLGEFSVGNQGKVVGEANESAKAFRHRLSKQAADTRPVALVGFREWIFSGSAGALGSFAAGSEFAFGTIVQRTMGNPGGVRFHYGHPDVWNKLFTMTRGGVSKATRAFHVSEDVFGGYNAIQRGAVIKYREYLSVGKGRDVGFEQINGFEAKVAGGNGEQSISRDAYRLGSRLDWFRLMSWYHSGIGFFMNTTLLMASVYLSVFVLFVFALADTLTLDAAGPDDTVIPALNSIQIVQLGMLSLIPYWGELCLESGFITGTFDILRQILAGAVMFFIFRQQTSAHYFSQDVYYGGASYIATGRGFALTHSSYVKLYSSFGRSHIYFGYQLALMALTLAFLSIPSYGLSTWGVWLVAVSLFFAPFWFNPLAFDFIRVREDYDAWRQWMAGDSDPGIKKSWLFWHREQLAKARNVKGLQTDNAWNRWAGVLMQTFNVIMVIATFERLDNPRRVSVDTGEVDPVTLLPIFVIEAVSPWDKGGLRAKQLGILLFEFLVISLAFGLLVNASFRGLKSNKVKRVGGFVIAILFFTTFVFYLVYFAETSSAGVSDFVLLWFANYTSLVVLVQLLLYTLPYNKFAQSIVDTGFYAADTIVGYITFGILFLFSLLPIVDSIQGTLLYNYEFVREARTGQQLKDLLKKQRQVRQDGDDSFRVDLMAKQRAANESAALSHSLPRPSPIPRTTPDSAVDPHTGQWRSNAAAGASQTLPRDADVLTQPPASAAMASLRKGGRRTRAGDEALLDAPRSSDAHRDAVSSAMEHKTPVRQRPLMADAQPSPASGSARQTRMTPSPAQPHTSDVLLSTVGSEGAYESAALSRGLDDIYAPDKRS